MGKCGMEPWKWWYGFLPKTVAKASEAIQAQNGDPLILFVRAQLAQSAHLDAYKVTSWLCNYRWRWSIPYTYFDRWFIYPPTGSVAGVNSQGASRGGS